MKNFNIMLIFDLIIAGLGVYLMYGAVMMRKFNEIPDAFVAEDQMKKCRDKKGFIHYMLPRTLIFSICCMVSGVLCFLADIRVLPFSRRSGSVFGIVMLLVFLFAWLIFASSMKNAKVKYFAPDLNM